MEYVWSLFLFPLLIILVVSFVVGVVVFIVDVIRWSKRPEKFEDISKDIVTETKEDIENIDDIL